MQPILLGMLLLALIALVTTGGVLKGRGKALSAKFQVGLFNLVYVGALSAMLELVSCDNDFEEVDTPTLKALPGVQCESSEAKALENFARFLLLIYSLIVYGIFMYP